MKCITSFLILLSVLLSTRSLAQSVGDFRTKQSGNWDQTTTWERFNGSSWVNASTPPSYTDGVITVRSAHMVTVTADVQIDQTFVFGTIIINASKVQSVRDGTGTDLQVYGTITNYGTLRQYTSGSPTLAYYSGAKYTHAVNGDRVEYATWHSNATCEITGVTSSMPSRMDQNFGHVIWNCTGQTSDITILDDMNQIQGNFSVLSTNNKFLELSNTSSKTMNIGSSFLISSGYFVLSDGSADNTMNVNGNFTINGGNYYMSTGTGYTSLNIKGDFSMTGGSLNQNSSYDRAVVNFNGTTQQTFTRSGGTMYYGISFYVKTGASIDFGTSVLGSHLYTTGSFTLESGATLRTAHSQGITTSGASGCIQVSGTRTYSGSASYQFYGSSSQPTGNGLPVTLTGVLTVGSFTNSTNLALTNGSVTINNKLVLVSSAPNNSSIATGTVSYGSNGILEYQGASAQTTANTEFPVTNGPRTVIVNNPHGVTLHASRVILTGLNLQQGQFSIGNNTLTLHGTVNQTSGTWAGGMSSNLVLAGAGASTNLPAITLNNLTVNRAAGIGLAGNIIVHGATTMTSGNLTSNGYFISYGENGTLLYNASVAQTCGVAEFPADNGPMNLTIQNSAGVLLHASRTISGTLSLTAGNFSIGSNTLTINGLINRTEGNITGGTGSDLLFGENETTTELPPVVLNNLTVNRSSGITMTGNATVNNLILSNGEFLIGSNQLTINGSIIQVVGTLVGGDFSSLTIGGSGSAANVNGITLQNLNINRTEGAILSGDLTVKNQLQLISGVLQIGSNAIYMDGNFQQLAGTLSGGVSSNISIRPGIFAFNLVNLPAVELSTLHVNRASGVIMNGNLTVYQNLELETGNLSIGAHVLTLNGALTETGGSLQSGENSSLIVGGTELTLNLGTGTLKLLQLNREAGIQLYNDLTMCNQLILIEGNINLNGFALTYQPGSTLRYAGHVTRVCTNAEFPETNGPTHLEIMNPAGVELHESRTIDGNLVIITGNFNIAANTLTLKGNLLTGLSDFSGRLVGSNQSDLIIDGVASRVNLNGITLQNLIINRAMGINMTGDLDLYGILTLENGHLHIMNNKLTLRNPVSGNPDLLVFMNESSLEIAGEAEGMNIGAEETIRVNDIKNLTISNSHESGVRLNGDLQIWSSLNVEPDALFVIGENRNLTVRGVEKSE